MLWETWVCRDWEDKNVIKNIKLIKKYLNFYIPVISILIILTGLAYLQYRENIYTPVDPSDSTNISFQIKKGEPVKQIAKNLEEKGLIRSDFSLYIYARANRLGQNIIAGRFLLNKSMNVPEILNTLSDPSQAEFVITIQEGLTIKDIEKKLIDMELVKEKEFLEAVRNFDGWEFYKFLDRSKIAGLDTQLEGYIYPDTYFLDPADFKPHDLIYLALDNFEKKIKGLGVQIGVTADPSMNASELHEKLIMASIIENEVLGAKDRKIVAGILWKRLENGWPLGADATILYITEDRTISAEDLEIDSPYNTRKFAGLPPGPISNPSIESIEAALNPTQSDYWFYLTTPDTGEVIYSKTNEEHNANRAKYL